ncbi:hypothetical protein [Pseudarthrobacter sp. BIM B-2242]|uniref:hypothetical protein n=1 Tax=Pseudarthrobacter sp. BIM B-2242 TaxID=2772401 RepID=UPI00168C1011|nr:hypothetical protein [Pseudarthrobacter sp. BIM B-2242]QOD02622.1 hypothetical protein IDT60_14860 [Pseudarthrobacter sp. BIM B-2242]
MNEASLPQDPVPWKNVEQSILRALATGGVSDELARGLLEDLSGLDVIRSYPIKPFPYGIINPDGIAVQIVLDRDGVRKLGESLIDIGRLDRFEYFPYGIIDPQIFVGRAEFRF